MTNCLVADNLSNYGTTDPWDSRGAAMYLQGRGELTNCTVVNNIMLQDFPYYGSGVYSGSSDPLIAKNCIVWGNHDLNGTYAGHQITITPGTATVTYTDIQDSYYSGGNNINQDPCFADPDGSDNDPNTEYDNDYRLKVDSPCKDTATAAGAPSIDLDGVTRPRDVGYDRGAYEYIYRYPGPWHVDGTVVVSGDGASWLSAFKTIEEAIDAAGYGHEIWVKGGTYVRSSSYQIDKIVRVYGGFDGTETQRSARDWEVNHTIFDGDNDWTGFYITSDITLDGFIFQNFVEYDGGALFIEDCDSIIANCTFQFNEAQVYGGAVYNRRTMTEYSNCTFWQNYAGDSGGAIMNEEAEPVYRDCTIKDNEAPGLGGGIYNMYANAVFEGCVISGNKATGEGTDGGGMTNDWSDPWLRNCLITGNWAAVGGGMSNYQSDPTIISCTIANNRAIEAGGDAGGVGGHDTIITVVDSIIWGNEATVQKEIGWSGAAVIDVQYSNIDQAGFAGDDGNLREDPLFAAPGMWDDNGTVTEPNDDIWIPGDYHLMSAAGRWDPFAQSWVSDAVTSPCIDTGDPCSDWSAELWPHGQRVNMGAYGGTAEASLSLPDIPPCWRCDTQCQGDFDCDGDVDTVDWPTFRDAWSTQYPEPRYNPCGDMDRDGDIDTVDWPGFRDHWQMEPLPGGCPSGGTWPPVPQ